LTLKKSCGTRSTIKKASKIVRSALRRMEGIHAEEGGAVRGAIGLQLPVYTDGGKPGLLYTSSSRVITCIVDTKYQYVIVITISHRSIQPRVLPYCTLTTP
jgi:hypothetical protein